MPLTRRTLLALAPVFYPMGADAVRIRFTSGTPSPSVAVEDGDSTVTTRRLT